MAGAGGLTPRRAGVRVRDCGFVPIPSTFWNYLGVRVEAETSLGAPPQSFPGHFQSVLGRGSACLHATSLPPTM